VRRLRKVLFATSVACALAFMSMLSVPIASAKSCEPKPLVCTFVLTFDPNAPDPHWEGPIAGDIVGTMQMYERWSDNYVVGGTEHYFEDFIITTSNGDVIKGYDKGVWNFATFKFRDIGWVTEASGDWAFLVGYHVLGMGTTTPYPPVPPETTVVGTGTNAITPP
jgi:hypothetical protein